MNLLSYFGSETPTKQNPAHESMYKDKPFVSEATISQAIQNGNLSISAQQTTGLSQAILKPLYFGGQEVPPDYVFIARRYVFAMVNPKPVTDGHILICPTRQVKSMQELTELETLELFACAKEVVNKFEDNFRVKNFMFLIQDGSYAGKKESGVYLQLIPREDQKAEINKQFTDA